MSRATFGRIVVGVALCVAVDTFAAHAQVVQLPTVHSFGVSTTVSVPDRGGAFLGGTAVHRSGRVARGFGVRLPGAHSLLRDSSHVGGLSYSRSNVTATIIDLREWDRAVLAEARRRNGQDGPVPSAVDRRAADISRHVATRFNLDQAHRALPRVGTVVPAASRPDSAASSQSPHGGEGNEPQDDSSHLSFDQLMVRGRAAMAARQYRLAKKYFQAAAAGN